METAKTGKVKEIKLEDMGYGSFFESNMKNLKLNNYLVGRVIAQYKGLYRVRIESGEYLAKITGKQMSDALSREDYPAVGDWVYMTEVDTERAMINGILPRKNILRKNDGNNREIRIIAANIDVAFIIESVDKDYNLNRFERYFVLAKNGNIKPVIVLNKIDLVSKEELSLKMGQLKDRFNNVDIIPSSIIAEHGLDEVTRYIKRGKTYCFLGSSGVGKSSLINKLLGRPAIKIGGLNLHTGKGKHTTTGREMYLLENGGIVIDNPGMREIGMSGSSLGIDSLFSEIIKLSKNCKYGNCTHSHEPGCEVIKAVEEGKIHHSRYDNYLSILYGHDWNEDKWNYI